MTASALFDVTGKTALVTGGSNGIGAMIARGLVESGVHVVITARQLERLQAMEAELSALGQCTAIQGDVSTLEGINALRSEMLDRVGPPNFLINNAGIAWGQTFEKFPERGWDPVMTVNVKSVFFMIQAFFPDMATLGTAEDPSRVVNIASINGLVHPKMPN